MAKYTPLAFEINLCSEGSEGFVFEVGSLFEALCTLHDQRDARGLRYRLVTVLVFALLAKLAGENHLRGIAQWVSLRAVLLASFLALAKVQAPHASTYSRILGKAIPIEEFEQVSRDFFARQPQAGTSVVISLDGKTMRGTIPAGQTHGIHLLAAFLPDEGWVLFQVEVGDKENEIPAAGRVLACLDLRGKIITGDALLAQRELSLQIVQAGGDYVWIIKDNQPETRQDIERLFAPERVVKGFSPASHEDFDTAETTEKSHGRLEHRKITVSSALKGYLNWPEAEQVFKLERHVERLKDRKVMDEVVYGVTSLTAQEANPDRLLTLIRKHWQIENGLHYRRDDTLKEDRCTLRTGHAAQAMAVINNVILGLLLRRGVKNVPDARRDFAADPKLALQLILGGP
jgi:predicted transposase YbfD/YdcC